MKKRWVVICALIVISIAFFYPKSSGYWNVLEEKTCKCYGISLEGPFGNALSEGFDYTCYGIVSDCVCRDGVMNNNRTVIPCE